MDLAAKMSDLARREINELNVEAGSKRNGSRTRAALVDKLLIYLAPKILSSGLGLASFEHLQALSDGFELHYQLTQMVGSNVRIIAQVAGRDQF